MLKPNHLFSHMNIFIHTLINFTVLCSASFNAACQVQHYYRSLRYTIHRFPETQVNCLVGVKCVARGTNLFKLYLNLQGTQEASHTHLPRLYVTWTIGLMQYSSVPLPSLPNNTLILTELIYPISLGADHLSSWEGAWLFLKKIK